MDCLVFRYVLIKLIRVFDGTVFNTRCTTRTLILQDIPWFLRKGYFEVSYFSLDTLNFCIGENLYVWMPADLDQLGCEYSHGAVVGRKGLVELGHVTAN
jgi:hypothetical protein